MSKTNRHDPRNWQAARHISTSLDGIIVTEGIGTGEFQYSAVWAGTNIQAHGSTPTQARRRVRARIRRISPSKNR